MTFLLRIRTISDLKTAYIEEPADPPIIRLEFLAGVLTWRLTGICDV